MIKYLGSKRLLLPVIEEVVRAIQPTGCVLDLFSGTSRVGHALKKAGYQVKSNDHNAYAAALGRCYVQADLEDHIKDVEKLVKEFNSLPGEPGYFTETFCERSRFFQPKNGAKVDAIREEIKAKGLNPELEAIMLVSLMEAADRVDSTTGVQMAYLKQWAKRAHNDLELRVPALLPKAPSGKGSAYQLDAVEATSLDADIAYIDPPYNQHKYLGNYHIWESLVLWDKPEVYGIACKRVDVRYRPSDFNSKVRAGEALKALFNKTKATHLVVSFSDEGYFSKIEIEEMLKGCRKHVVTLENDFKRYVGAQIGIHNDKGDKVGKVSHLRNVEYIYVASNDEATIARVRNSPSS